jgi:DNA-binding NtrC family response regulator
MKKILVVDDESTARLLLKKILTAAGYNVSLASNGIEAVKKINNSKYDAVITDLNMPEMSGVELTKKILENEPDMIVILITAFGSIRSAIDSIRSGAFEYLTKPVDKEELLLTLNRGFEKVSLIKENILLSRELDKIKESPISETDSEKVKNIKEYASTIAQSNNAVLITGEAGTGKRELALHIHLNSPRKKYRFITIDCTTLPENSIESELFGHVKGSSKKATTAHKGYLEIAERGTIYINEISKFNNLLQLKLLRVLKEGVYTKAGDLKTQSTSARFIISTTIDLEQLVIERKFNEELYKKLKLYELYMPALRERPEDIIFYFNYFLNYYASIKNLKIKEILPDVTRLIINYVWPGNITELKNVAERAVILSDNSIITKSLFPANIQEVDQYRDLFSNNNYKVNKNKAIRDFEISFLKKYLKLCKGNISETARVINFHQISLRQKIAKLKINPKEFIQK